MVEEKVATMAQGRKGLIKKTLERCRSSASKGCLTVYVGDRRQRFVVRTECVNHPLFRALLEEAEEAFGYAAAGPLQLPCDAAAFAAVLERIREEKVAAVVAAAGETRRRGLARGHSAYRLLVPGHPVLAGGQS